MDKESPVIDNQPDLRVSVDRRNPARHLLPTRFAVLPDGDMPITLLHFMNQAVVTELSRRRHCRIRDAQRPVSEAGHRDGPAITLAQIDLSIPQFRNFALLVRQRYAPAIALDSDCPYAEWPAYRRTELIAVLPPPQLAVESLVASADTDAAGKLPSIEGLQYAAPGVPVCQFG